ncbi:multiple epidermal growth factor-like domains protein 10 isoform X2 [Haliotis rufescens]|uniref:multiple epidermal growth factor-like domains protein 10 isoform X2 n=1 Tax=Haliotis rufescens TaxID=6454 RepID=UPI00201E76D1|nr:multiple epidermal growth factor-like domains protein 10 isoform X2 [Haliotis rufescens]
MATAVAPHIYRLLLLYFLHISLSQQAASQECHCTSGCDVNFRCTDGCLQSWSGPTCQIRNIALNKPTQQSSTINDCQWASTAARKDVCGNKTSSLAVDGVTSSSYWSGTCIHTATGWTSAWWTVDLGETHLITNLTIFFSNRQRMTGFLVRVDDHPCYQQDQSHLPRSPVSISCDTPTRGQRVTVQLPTLADSKYILNLCEVEIYECADGSFGPGCSSWCLCKNTSEVCDKDTGHCESGCADGHTGADCQEPCSPGRYGQGCMETCGHCDGGDQNCNKVDGRCTHVCQDNWSGTLCKECSDYWFGGRCDRECKCKDPSEACDKKTGQCDSGCEDGWTGLDCQTPCQDGTYGFNCTSRCGRCRGGVPCDKIGGECAKCDPGFIPPLCKQCKDGHFGVNCTQSCRCLNVTEICDKTTGECRSGCEAGRTGRGCQRLCESGSYGLRCEGRCGQCAGGHKNCSPYNGSCHLGCEGNWRGRRCGECKDRFYGAQCSYRCGRCRSNAICSKTSGDCPDGCEPGWQGMTCDQECDGDRYGDGCSETCGQCAGKCSPVTGTCDQEGCSDGWMGQTCDEECRDGHFGVNCTQSCLCLNVTEICDKTTGECRSGCEAGRTGRGCQRCIRNTDSKLIIPVVGSCVAIIIIIIAGNVAVTMYILRRRRVRQGETTADDLECVNLGRQEEGEDVDSTPQIYQNTTTSTGIYEDLSLTPDHVYEEPFGASEHPGLMQVERPHQP